MRYMGGKTRIAKRLAEAVRANTTATKLWEPFCGGLNATKTLVDVGFEVVATDADLALVSLLLAWRNGWRPPPEEAITRENWELSKRLPDSDPLKGFFGFGFSFGSKFFRGFADPCRRYPDGYKRRHYQTLSESLTEETKLPSLIGKLSFFDWPAEPSPGWAIYADPPYANTETYRLGAFDHAAFWRRCREWQSAGVDVFVSEYSAPPDVPVVAKWPTRSTVGARSNDKFSLERLYLLAAEKEQRA